MLGPATVAPALWFVTGSDVMIHVLFSYSVSALVVVGSRALSSRWVPSIAQ
jgi:hypothetical protein